MKNSRRAQGKSSVKSTVNPASEPASLTKKNEFHNRLTAQLGEVEAPLFFESLKKRVAERSAKRNVVRSLRLNPLRRATDSTLEALGIKITAPVPWLPELGRYFQWRESDLTAHPATGAALFYLQEAGAMEPVALLAPEPGELVLDLCAAPGGKTTQILEQMGGKGWLVANEPVGKRAERLDALVARNGALNVSLYALDPDTLCNRFGPVFDRVLVDAPCSGESLFAKRDDIRRDIRDVDVKGCARRQFTILSRAAECVKPGGVLVYSTCTYSREENEEIVQAFLDAYPAFTLEREHRRWPHKDGVAGGYAAKMIHQTKRLAGARESTSTFEMWQTTSGLIRHGFLRWNEEVDVYALAQSFDFDDPKLAHPDPDVNRMLQQKRQDFAGFTDVTVDTPVGQAFLRGEAIANQHAQQLGPDFRGLCRVLWQGHPLGAGKAVEGRINNLVPKMLRTVGEF